MSNNPKNFNESNLSAIEIIKLMKNGKLRLMDDPNTVNIASHLAINPDDIYLNELFMLKVNEALAEAMISDDEFRENYPPAHSIMIQPDMLICGVMPTGDPIVMRRDRLFCNVGVFGRTGSGKTSWIYLLIKQLLIKGFIDETR